MVYLLPFRFSTVPVLALGLLLSSCCANNVCDCQDDQADVVPLSFSPAFSAADLDTIIITRSPRPYLLSNKVESVSLIRTAARARDTIQLNNNTPFAQVGSTKLSGYRYEVQYLVAKPGSKPVPTTALVIDSVQLAGSLESLESDGCCTCYTNTKKTAFTTRAKNNGAVLDSIVVTDLTQRPTLEVTK